MLVTNGRFTTMAQDAARARDIYLLSANDLWRILDATPCTAADIEFMEGRRLASMRDVQVAIEDLLRSVT